MNRFRNRLKRFRVPPKTVNLVLGGGGIKGIGLVGALSALEENGYHFNCIAGCSAGAIVAAFQAGGMDSGQMLAKMETMDFRKLRDSYITDRFGTAGKGWRVARRMAMHSGDNLYRFISETLEEIGIKTFADLKIERPDMPKGYNYKLVVIAADISRGVLLRLPWDYHQMGLDPDKQPVADAIRASTALPFFYQPVEIGKYILMDGGVITSYPISIFQSIDGLSHFPTIGVRLSGEPDLTDLGRPINGPLDLARAIVLTGMKTDEAANMVPEIAKKTILVNTPGVKFTDFNIDRATQKRMFEDGYKAAVRFLAKR